MKSSQLNIVYIITSYDNKITQIKMHKEHQAQSTPKNSLSQKESKAKDPQLDDSDEIIEFDLNAFNLPKPKIDRRSISNIQNIKISERLTSNRPIHLDIQEIPQNPNNAQTFKCLNCHLVLVSSGATYSLISIDGEDFLRLPSKEDHLNSANVLMKTCWIEVNDLQEVSKIREIKVLHCKLCGEILGYIVNDMTYFQAGRLIVQKPCKRFKIGLLSLHLDKISPIESSLAKTIGKNNESIQLVRQKIYKGGSTEDIEKELYDVILVVHKIELRTFLLGRNGLYNNLFETLYSKLSKSF